MSLSSCLRQHPAVAMVPVGLYHTGGGGTLIYKRCSRCGKRLPTGTTCPCIKNRHKEYDRFSRDRETRAYYNSAEWLTVRSAALEADQMMDVYLFMTQGKIVRADTVHHIVPLRSDWNRRNELSNLMSLSHESHSLIEAEYRRAKATEGEAGLRKLQSELAAMLKEYRALVARGAV